MSRRPTSAGTVPWILLLLCVLSYGWWIPGLGLYWEDWAKLWIAHTGGSAGAGTGRPYLGQIVASLAPFLGEDPVHWHVLSLCLRWLAALSFWWLLRGLWPEKKLEVACIAFLFAVYPGFTLQPIAWVSSQVVWLPFCLFLFSLGAMVWALRKPSWFLPLTTVAVMTSIASVAIKEYYLGLELLRPLLLCLVLAEAKAAHRPLLRRTAIHWLPYSGVLLVFFVWRFFLFKTTASYQDPSTHLSSLWEGPLAWTLIRLLKAVSDVVEACLMSWTQTLHPEMFRFGSEAVWVGWGLTVLTGLGVAIFLMRLRDRETQLPGQPKRSWSQQAIALGLFAVVVGLLPALFINRHIVLGTLEDRRALPAMVGACIFLVGLMELGLRRKRHKIILISVIVGLAVGFHSRNAERFRNDWSVVKSFLWQLSWRAPALKPGTSLLTGHWPLSVSESDVALAVPLNLLYGSGNSSEELDYWLFALSWESGRQVPSFVEDADLRSFRYFASFVGSTSNSLVLWFSPPNCLRLVDPSRDEIPALPPLERAARRISHLERVDVGAPHHLPPAEIFGTEPEHGWCYYFQKADLARQKADWEEVVRIGDEARRLGHEARDASEWLPFIEGYFQVARYQDASSLAGSALHQSRLLQETICDFWKRLEAGNIEDGRSRVFLAEMNQRFDCEGSGTQSTRPGFSALPQSSSNP